MIADCEKWHYLAVKSLSVLFRGITSNHKEEFYCLNSFHSYTRKEKLEKHKKGCENHNYCYVQMPGEDNKIFSLNMEDITDDDHRHAKRVFKNLSNKNLGDYHDLYVQSDTLLLADVF